MIVVVAENKGAKTSSSKKASYGKREATGVKKATALLEHWVKDLLIRLHEVKFLPSNADQKDVR